MMDINANAVKTYATKDNLAKGLAKLGIADHPHCVVRNDEGRYTAIFPFSNYRMEFLWGGQPQCYVAYYASLGFMTLG